MSGQYCTRAMFYQHQCRARDAAADCSLQSLMSVISELSARHWNSAPRHCSAVQCTDTAAMQKKGLVGNVGKCNAMQKKGLGNVDKCTSFTSCFCCDPTIMSRKSYPPHILAAKWAEYCIWKRNIFNGIFLRNNSSLSVLFRILGHSPWLFCGFLCFQGLVAGWRQGRQIKYLIPFIRQDINRSTVFRARFQSPRSHGQRPDNALNTQYRLWTPSITAWSSES